MNILVGNKYVLRNEIVVDITRIDYEKGHITGYEFYGKEYTWNLDGEFACKVTHDLDIVSEYKKSMKYVVGNTYVLRNRELVFITELRNGLFHGYNLADPECRHVWNRHGEALCRQLDIVSEYKKEKEEKPQMQKRKIKPLKQIINENEIHDIESDGSVYLYSSDDHSYYYYIHVSKFENWETYDSEVDGWPDNFYKKIETVTLKTLDKIKSEFFHKIKNTSNGPFLIFQIIEMPGINDDMFKYFGTTINKDDIKERQKGYEIENWNFDKRWFENE